VITMLAAFAQFERTVISERIEDSKRPLPRQIRHKGGLRPFGFDSVS